MSLTNLSQIKGLQKLRNDADLLLKSYEASKVLTQIAKEGEGAGNYSVEELLADLKVKIEALSNGGGNATLDELKKAVEDLQNKGIKAFTGEATEPTKLYKLVELPEDALLQQSELDIAAYQAALDALVAKLAANRELVNAVKELVGNDNIAAQIEEAIAKVTEDVDAKAEKSELEALQKKVEESTAKLEKLASGNVVVIEELSVPATGNVALTGTPTTDVVVCLHINGAVYYEEDDFDVNRTSKEIVWNVPDFAIAEVASKATARYMVKGGNEPINPSFIQVDESKIVLTREEPQKSFNVTIPADCTLSVEASDPTAVEITVTEVK